MLAKQLLNAPLITRLTENCLFFNPKLIFFFKGSYFKKKKKNYSPNFSLWFELFFLLNPSGMQGLFSEKYLFDTPYQRSVAWKTCKAALELPVPMGGFMACGSETDWSLLDYRRSHSLLSEPLQLACYHKQKKLIVLCCTGKVKTINLHNFRLAAFTLQCNKVMLYHIEEFFYNKSSSVLLWKLRFTRCAVMWFLTKRKNKSKNTANKE